MRVNVSAGALQKEVLTDAYLAVNRSRLRSYDQTSDAHRVMRCHRFLFRVPPTIVLQPAERDAGEGYAAISSSCRALVAAGFRVIVDASHNSLSDAARDTKRVKMLVVEPMSRDVLEGLGGDLGGLIDALRAARLDDVVDYGGIRELWRVAKYGDVAPVVESFVSEQLNKAIKIRDDAQTVAPGLKQLHTRFEAAEAVPRSELKTLGLIWPSPDKVPREVTRGGKQVLVPATQAMAVVLRYNLEQGAPSLDALKAMLSKDKVIWSAWTWLNFMCIVQHMCYT